MKSVVITQPGQGELREAPMPVRGPGQALLKVLWGGRVVQVGVGKQTHDFAYTVLQTKELDVFGSRNALASDFTELIGRLRAGRVDVSPLVSAVYDVQDVAAAFSDTVANAATVRKTLVRLGAEA